MQALTVVILILVGLIFIRRVDGFHVDISEVCKFDYQHLFIWLPSNVMILKVVSGSIRF